MKDYRKQHVFTAELPYEKDAVVALFLRNRFERVDDFIMSLGQMSNIPPSKLLTYEKGELVSEKVYSKNYLGVAGCRLYFFYIPKSLLLVTFDMIRSLKSINFTCDIFFAQHFLPAFIAVILRKIGVLKCRKIVFWMFDLFLIPPEFIRSFYYRGIDSIQRYIRKNVDEIWYSTPRLEECDKVRFGPLPKKITSRITHGLFFKRIAVNKPPAMPPLRLAFLGSLRPNNATRESLDSVCYCRQHGLNVELLIIGSGPDEVFLKEYAKKKRISGAVKFYGFEDRGEMIAKIFSKCHIGLALYTADPYGPNWFLTSGKFRRFISQGLPVITTSVPYFAKYIHQYQAGFVVDNDPADVYRVLKNIYENPPILKTLERGVNKLYNLYNADRVFDEAFKVMLNND